LGLYARAGELAAVMNGQSSGGRGVQRAQDLGGVEQHRIQPRVGGVAVEVVASVGRAVSLDASSAAWKVGKVPGVSFWC